LRSSFQRELIPWQQSRMMREEVEFRRWPLSSKAASAGSSTCPQRFRILSEWAGRPVRRWEALWDW